MPTDRPTADPTPPSAPGRWSRRKLWLVLYPFTTAAVAINLFLIGLIGPFIGLPNLPPVLTLILSLPLGIPATFATTRWVDHLLDEAKA